MILTYSPRFFVYIKVIEPRQILLFNCRYFISHLEIVKLNDMLILFFGRDYVSMVKEEGG